MWEVRVWCTRVWCMRVTDLRALCVLHNKNKLPSEYNKAAASKKKYDGKRRRGQNNKNKKTNTCTERDISQEVDNDKNTETPQRLEDKDKTSKRKTSKRKTSKANPSSPT
jgi:hypothetical protein